MNPDLDRLQPYPFERLAAIKAAVSPPDLPAITLAIGEPRQAPPEFVRQTLIEALDGLVRYPTTRGDERLRETIADWLRRRYRLPGGALDADRHVLPVTGTREALFAIAQCLCDRHRPNATVVMPNPFYQIYEGAALLAGARPWYLNTTAADGWLPDFERVPEAVWRDCQLIYLCSPGNPSGRVIPLDALQGLITLADRHDFVIVADECYAEIYRRNGPAPVGLLEAAAALGRDDFARCLVFHSLSKRSNLPGMRSGFVAGDARLIAAFLRYRTYHGCSMPPYHQEASIQAWRDEAHVDENRRAYDERFAALAPILRRHGLEVELPPAGFYLWLQTPIDDADFAQGLYATANVTVLPGSFLSREAAGINPGKRRVRMALVQPLETCIEAAERIGRYVDGL